jgi:hypothetical protein
MRDPLVLTLPSAPSMFGRKLTEQVQADSKGEERQIPVIVEKCIEAVEARGWYLQASKATRLA